MLHVTQLLNICAIESVKESGYSNPKVSLIREHKSKVHQSSDCIYCIYMQTVPCEPGQYKAQHARDSQHLLIQLQKVMLGTEYKLTAIRPDPASSISRQIRTSQPRSSMQAYKRSCQDAQSETALHCRYSLRLWDQLPPLSGFVHVLTNQIAVFSQQGTNLFRHGTGWRKEREREGNKEGLVKWDGRKTRRRGEE